MEMLQICHRRQHTCLDAFEHISNSRYVCVYVDVNCVQVAALSVLYATRCDATRLCAALVPKVNKCQLVFAIAGKLKTMWQHICERQRTTKTTKQQQVTAINSQRNKTTTDDNSVS